MVEIGCPAVHDTCGDLEMTLPNGIVNPQRSFDGMLHRPSNTLPNPHPQPLTPYNTTYNNKVNALIGMWLLRRSGHLRHNLQGSWNEIQGQERQRMDLAGCEC